jgi:hypothetical protein
MLTFQFPIHSLGDFDRMIELENRMTPALGAESSVDGHDAGSGEGNLFILTNAPRVAFDQAFG